MYKKFVKRLIDLSISITLFMFISPVFLTVMLVLAIIDNGKVFFTQLRPGKNEKLFRIYKFKTMKDLADKNGKILPDALRLTKFGRIIRKSSIDELPQLLNVIKGDMSLVGPRPLLPQYLPFYSHQERVRHKVRPGITGWAQVNGRNVSTWDNRLAADIYYCNNLSFSLDLLVFYKTIKNIFSGKDVIVDSVSAMDPLDVERTKNDKPENIDSAIV